MFEHRVLSLSLFKKKKGREKEGREMGGERKKQKISFSGHLQFN